MMRKLLKPLIAFWLLLAVALPAFAVLPDEVLDDPQLEARARAISAELRCMVCQNQSIDDSDAELARDLRILVRERLEAGATDEEVIDYLVSRYGEFVLLRPTFNIRNALLWGAPLLILALGAIAIGTSLRRRHVSSAALTEEEKREIARILRERE